MSSSSSFDYNNMLDRALIVKGVVDRAIGRKNELLRNIQLAKAEIEESSKKEELYRKTVLFLENIISQIQENTEQVLSDIGTSALQRIFVNDSSYLSVKFEDTDSGKATRVSIKVKQQIDDKGNFIENDLFNAEGGAVVDVISYILRLVLLEIYNISGPVILDETFRYIASDERMHFCGEFTKQLAEKLGRQIILITHSGILTQYSDNNIMVMLDADNRKAKVVDHYRGEEIK